jgi:hypothetical protein
MALAAAQVIDALAARLVPMTATGGRVYTSRAWPLAEADLPAWRVTAEDETVTPAMVEPINLHTLRVAARCIAMATADLDDVLHALAASGLALLFAGTVPYGLVLDGIRRQLATENEAKVGVITLDLTFSFYVAPETPETIHS